MANHQIYSFAPLFLCIIVIFKLIPIVIPKPHNGFSLQLIQRNPPQSRFYVQNLSTSQRSTRLNTSSNSSKISESDFDTQRLRFDLTRDPTAIFYVKLHFGNPAIPLYLLPDTASDIFWTQCEPCTYKYRQRSPIYNSTASRTYSKLPCEHPFCTNNNSLFRCINGSCVYRLRYGNGATTEGVASSDLLQTSENTQMPLYFGCSQKNRFFRTFERTGMTGGIMGLSMSPVSLLYQLANRTQHRFSYCLPPLIGNVTTLLRFGDDISTRGIFKSTPIVTPPGKWKYFVNLRDISVEGHRMNFPPNTFAIREGGNSGGCIIDSGTSVTRIIEQAYRPLLRAYQAYLDSHGLERVNLPVFDLCYRRRERMPKLASMTYHFEGADFEVEPNHVYWVSDNQKAFCVELLNSQNRTILGGNNQINTRFILDAGARQIRFSPENCEHDR